MGKGLKIGKEMTEEIIETTRQSRGERIERTENRE